MKLTLTTAIVAGLLAGYLLAQNQPTTATPTVDSMRPVVVKTVPEAGSKDVAAGEMEIKVKFSKEMSDGSWSWATAWKDSSPPSLGKPHYEADHRTCIIKVKLEPGRTYGYWLNSEKFPGFRDKGSRPSVPYLLVFETKK